MAAAESEIAARRRIRVKGVVQGVGFRPYVFRLARRLELAGSVRNDAHGVLIEIEGPADRIDAFVEMLPAEAPPLATVESVSVGEMEATGEIGFQVASSRAGGTPDALVSADAATCADCLAEMRSADDRRHRYPFVNCTNCGPRFTIIRAVPYDRPSTTMADFRMCEPCRAEFDDPGDRRFHAQPIACPDCGPQLRLASASEPSVARVGPDALEGTLAALRDGRIVAVKGIGGYHLACRADDQAAVSRLRSRKHREDRPFALMVADAASARELVELTGAEEQLLLGRERPIVIARRRSAAAVAAAVAPGRDDLGVMVAYSPLHHLITADLAAPLVMTSANVSDEPIAFRDDDASARLRDVADLICSHDRPIHIRTDDSVVRALDPGLRPQPLLIRRSRGYVPGEIGLPIAARRPILACGAELKNTFCLAKADHAWVSHHIGDLKNFETLSSYRSGVAHFERLFAVEPALIAHDLHPDYLSTRYAEGRSGEATVSVQHHHAHLAAVLAEHGRTDRAIGAIFDGIGLGPDRTVWGGEFLIGGLAGYERGGLLFPVRMPGGDFAAREPWRMACSWLGAAFEVDRPPLPATLAGAVEPARWEAVCEVVRTGVASPLTTSVGRLFDAVAALCGLRHEVSHEGQAAADLEAAAGRDPAAIAGGEYVIDLVFDGQAPLILDPRAAIREIARDLAAGVGISIVSARFHLALARAAADACERLAEREAVDLVVLSGGVFQNRLLLERTATLLAETGLRVLLPVRLPPNDGAISFGQAAVAACLDAQ